MRSTVSFQALAACFAGAALAQDSTSSNSSSALGLIGSVDLGSWADAYEKAKTLVASFTNDEKLAIIVGSSVSSNGTGGNWTALNSEDGSEGVEQYLYASSFSQLSAMAFTWDRDAMYEQARAIAAEFYGKGFQVINGPTSAPLGRTPWNGRMGEACGVDSYLNGIVFGLTTKGYNDVGMLAGGKHFLLYEQETNRNSPYSSNADDKTIHESYLWPFYDGIKNGMGAIMCAMNSVNGSYSCENEDLLMGLLKTELGFPGYVYADVGALRTALGSVVNGLDQGSSRTWTTTVLNQMLSNGSLTDARLDDMVIRNVIGYYKNEFNSTQLSKAKTNDYRDVRANHSAIIRENGAKSMVLLKNVDNTLPLQRPRFMSIFGAHAGPAMGGPNVAFSVFGSGPTFLGHLATGTGSGQGSLSYLITPQQALTLKASQDGTMIAWVMNDTYSATGNAATGNLASQVNFDLTADETAVTPSFTAYASMADVCLVFINALAGEGADRTELYNQEQDIMVQNVTSECNNTVVVVNTVGPRLVDQWIDNDNITAVLYGTLLGQESGHAIMDILYGTVNPSARLPYTIAKNESDYNAAVCEELECDFVEGNYIDYKYFDAYNVTPRYEFGYGLSYTTFGYSNLQTSVNFTASGSSSANSTVYYASGTRSVGGRTDLWDTVATVTATIANTGSYDGAEVAQLYISYPSIADQPLRALRGFEKVDIASGGSADVTFSLRWRDLSFWDVAAQEWAVAQGTYDVYVGASSRDLRLTGSIEIV